MKHPKIIEKLKAKKSHLNRVMSFMDELWFALEKFSNSDNQQSVNIATEDDGTVVFEFCNKDQRVMFAIEQVESQSSWAYIVRGESPSESHITSGLLEDVKPSDILKPLFENPT